VEGERQQHDSGDQCPVNPEAPPPPRGEKPANAAAIRMGRDRDGIGRLGENLRLDQRSRPFGWDGHGRLGFTARLLAGSAAMHPKLGHVLTGRNQNAHRLSGALGFVELGQAFPEPVYFHANAGVVALLEILRLPENIHCDGVFGDLLGHLQERLAAQVLEESAEPGRLPECLGVENRTQRRFDFGDRRRSEWELRVQGISICLSATLRNTAYSFETKAFGRFNRRVRTEIFSSTRGHELNGRRGLAACGEPLAVPALGSVGYGGRVLLRKRSLRYRPCNVTGRLTNGHYVDG
jgi:hypothetical protein